MMEAHNPRKVSRVDGADTAAAKLGTAAGVLTGSIA
jgi:hypothetical protein